jgi:hypothetical protein
MTKEQQVEKNFFGDLYILALSVPLDVFVSVSYVEYYGNV